MGDREKLVELMKETEGKIIDEEKGMSAEELDERLLDGDGYGFYADHLIANGVVVREKGEWKRRGRNLGECSNCGEVVAVRYNFCPNCGADMKKEG